MNTRLSLPPTTAPSNGYRDRGLCEHGKNKHLCKACDGVGGGDCVSMEKTKFCARYAVVVRCVTMEKKVICVGDMWW